MKAICFLLLFTLFVRADETGDRKAIARLVADFNEPGYDRAKLFAFGTDVAAQLSAFETEPFSEESEPKIEIRVIRFLNSRVAVVEGVTSQYGSLFIVRRALVEMTLKKERRAWKIVRIDVAWGPETPSPALR